MTKHTWSLTGLTYAGAAAAVSALLGPLRLGRLAVIHNMLCSVGSRDTMGLVFLVCSLHTKFTPFR